MGSDGVREKDGAPLTIRALYVVEIENSALSMELAMAHGRSSASTCSCRVSTGPVQHDRLRDPGMGRVPRRPQPRRPEPGGAVRIRPQPPDGVNFSAVANPEYDALVAEASALTGAEACEVWNAAEAELYAQMNILPLAATTAPSFGNGAEFAFGRIGIIANSLRLVEA